MEKKQFYIGDLCYVMHPEWDEFCNLTIKGMDCLDGEFTLADGRKFITHRTKYGDGCYNDQYGKSYGVDAGLIGAIAVDDISDTEKSNINLGNVYEFSTFPTISYDNDNGAIIISDGTKTVVIITGYDEDYEDYES